MSQDINLNTVQLSESESRVVEALQKADEQLDGLTEALAKNSTDTTGDVANIIAHVGDTSYEFDAADSSAGFIVGQIANKLSQSMSTIVTPESKKDDIAKTISQKAG